MGAKPGGGQAVRCDGRCEIRRSEAPARLSLMHPNGRASQPRRSSRESLGTRVPRDSVPESRTRIRSGAMRATSRRRPLRRTITAAPEGVDPEAVAARVRYVGSPEHKSYRSFAGPPRLRVADASKCDPRFVDAAPLTAWLRESIRAGRFGAPWEGDFPKYVWFVDGDTCYEARLVNRASGEYKGWELAPEERPEGL